MEFDIEKCAFLIMRNGKGFKKKPEGIEQTN